MLDRTRNKKVLFLTTHNIDYIRNTQHIRQLKKQAGSLTVLYGKSKNHVVNAGLIFLRLLFTPLKNVDVVVVSYMAQTIIPLLWWKFRRKTVVTDFFISLYDSMVNDRKLVSEKHPLARLIFWVDRFTVLHSDYLIADTKAHRDYFVETFGADKGRTEVIYLEVDSSIYYPRPQAKPEKWENSFLVLYFGSVIPLQGVDIILQAVREMADDREVQFLIIGPVKKRYEPARASNVTYLDWVTQEELAAYIAQADLCLAGHFNAGIEKAKRTIPGKAYIYRAMGRPMILGDNPANHELFQEDGEGIYYVEMGNPGALVKKIREIKACKFH